MKEKSNATPQIILLLDDVANNCVRLELNCWEQNENTLKFYKKLGLKTQKRVMEIKIN